MRRPGYLALLARLLIPRRDREFIVGDLDELYAKRAGEEGRLTANLRYLQGVLASAAARRFERGRRERDPTPGGQRSRVVCDMAADIRHAVRSLRHRPSFTIMVVSTLALGIGPTAAVFGMVNQLILRPLPGVANSGTAAYLRFGVPGRYVGLTLLDFDELREGTTLLEGIASYGLTDQNVTLDNSRPIAVLASTIYGDFFEVLGVEPSAGRLLSSSETGLDANPLVAVISESLRGRLFGPREEVVGRTVRMNGQPVTIVGVAGGDFTGPERGIEVEAWLPHTALVPLVDFTREILMSADSSWCARSRTCTASRQE